MAQDRAQWDGSVVLGGQPGARRAAQPGYRAVLATPTLRACLPVWSGQSGTTRMRADYTSGPCRRGERRQPASAGTGWLLRPAGRRGPNADLWGQPVRTQSAETLQLARERGRRRTFFFKQKTAYEITR